MARGLVSDTLGPTDALSRTTMPTPASRFPRHNPAHGRRGPSFRLARCGAWAALAVAGLALGSAAAQALEAGTRLARPGASAAGAEAFDSARVIVKYRAGSAMRRALSGPASEGSLAPAPRHAARMALAVRAPLQDGRVLGPHTQALRGQGLSSSELVRRLQALPEVEWAVVDERRRIVNTPNDPLYAGAQTGTTPVAGQWYLREPSSELVSAINAAGAWSVSTGSANVIVAVLDTGVRIDHPDLAGKLVAGYDFVGLDRSGTPTTANDGDGRDNDPSDPGDWTNADECVKGEPAYPSSWHGTSVSGLIGAATNNGVGMAGAAWQARVLPVRVLGRCGGYDSDIIAAMRWAAGVSQEVGVGTSILVPNAHPARVINMSLGSSGVCTQAYREVVAELQSAGTTVVAAAGNDTGLKVSVPASCPGVIAVAGVRHAGSKVGYSNIGPEVALAAPAGNCVNLQGPCLYPLLTTTNLGLRQPGAHGYSDGSNFTVGTSFAAPLVAGTVALMLAVDPSLTPAKIREILQATTRPFPTSRPLGPGEEPVPACRAPDNTDQLECFCTATTCGSGMLDAGAAVARVYSLIPPPPPGGGGSGSSGGSGGGSSGTGWLLGLLLGAMALHGLNRRERLAQRSRQTRR